jgi:hypothetical protein
MAAYTDGLLALDRIRRGGRQTVNVIHQHVAVGPGGSPSLHAASDDGRPVHPATTIRHGGVHTGASIGDSGELDQR